MSQDKVQVLLCPCSSVYGLVDRLHMRSVIEERNHGCGFR